MALVKEYFNKRLLNNKKVKEYGDNLNAKIEKIFTANKIYMNGKRIFSFGELENFVINIHDDGNKHNIHLHSTRGNGKIYINLWGRENTFYIGEDNVINNDMFISYWGCSPNIFPNKVTVEIGNNNVFNGEQIKIICPIGKNRKIKIGDYNLFGGYITFRGRNDHLIYDINTKKRINEDNDIILENNIWICDSVVFLPKTFIKGNAIIAERSLVNKGFNEMNVLLAGVPADIKKRNVMWNKNLDKTYLKSKNPID